MTSANEIKLFWANKAARRLRLLWLVGILCLLCLPVTTALASEHGTEEPGIETPDTEEPGMEEPGMEDFDTDEPGMEDFDAEEPGMEDFDTEEPGTEDLDTEEPGTEDPDTEEPWEEEPQPQPEPIGDITIIDSFTGEEVDSEAQSSTPLIKLSDRAYYDTENGCYCYTLSTAGVTVTSSIMDGMLTQDEVAITIPDNLIFELYRNGELYGEDFSFISEQGSYTLNYIKDGGSEHVLSFRIIGKIVGDLYLYPMPAGFRVVEVFKDGERIATRREEADLTEEGSYEISYRSPTAELDYELRVTVDHTPPSFVLTGLKEGTARGPVQISELEAGVSLYVYLEGTPIRVKSENGVFELTQSGRYTVLAIDEAGNETREQFTILIYLTAGSILFFLILAAGIVAGIVYAIMARKRLRIR